MLQAEYIQRNWDIFEKSFEAFVRYFLADQLIYEVPEFHKEIYNLLPNTNRLVLAAPRGFAKSYISSKFYPLWLALFQKRQDICIISASETLAIEHLRFIKRELESNPKFQLFFGDVISKKWTENHIILNNKVGVNIRARGAGGQIRGFRPDCVILDDIETDETVLSEEQRKKLKDWLFRACLNTLLPNGQLVLIGTVIHPLSVLNDLLKVPNGWEKRRFMAYKDERQEAGNELWPNPWSHEKLQIRKKEIGSFAFSSEFLNNPMLDESSPIKENQLRFWDKLPQQYSCVIALDPAYSDDDKADYKVAVVVAIDQNKNRYLLDYVRTHEPTGAYIDKALNKYIRYKDYLTGFGVPNSGTEKEFYRTVQEKIQARKLDSVPLMALKNTFTTASGQSKKNKYGRVVASLQPLFEQGKYYIHATHGEAREELLTIGSSRWDDLVDAMAYAEQILQPVYYDNKQLEEASTAQDKLRGTDGYGLTY